MKKMYRSTFQMALIEAIEYLKKTNRGDFMFTLELEEILKASENGEKIKIG